ncbi:F-box and WD domain protein [Talaromyces stipitatus ATCC 10500]|uniref:Probable E3 ubiquitin ligase complex SCF subunit sconB n=1 Tax=Talaromyces stipitatus (strain ATCC 10500 / CBS 375.48 / QM 6759 / NRRL 1006) TaxID=441959 RepID=B8LVY2_TALSN|nr:F-box and WD domain protein [Talaromyces stipitatus ATCC 10500]EED24348.1 F-box and WD domain protein [Talaromyces stipitatus ATCC 10500]
MHSSEGILRMRSDKPPYTSASLAASYKLDEGYSDDTKSQLDGEDGAAQNESMLLPDWILAYSDSERAELAYSILSSLPTTSIASVVERLTPRLHMDPVLRLPPEITAEIFSYLDPATLFTASLASRGWRNRIIDPRLWRDMYIREGWRVDIDAIKRYEELHTERLMSQTRKSRSRHADSESPQPQLKRRVTEASLQSRGACDGDAQSNPPWNEQHQTVEADVPTTADDDDNDREMRDVNGAGQSFSPADHQFETSTRHSPLLVRLPNGTAKINWPYLYKQRRRLEDNWIKGRFTTFMLPHPAYPDEAHQQCVYALQFSDKWLVSGSRDTTIRVWDLSRMRLSLPPLRGHQTSVLCLQFDPSSEEDVIISGGSDRRVIVWKFSTGQKVLELTNAHHDSVLNLKFDKRYLVTCSKDKFIKIWNRRSLTPLDKDYPAVVKGAANKYPAYIIDTTLYSPSWLEANLANGNIKRLEPYTLLMTLEGHGAAINAIQIHGDEIVSAAGDRLIKIWSIRNGSCLKTVLGHDKGIACVQFDNRRIISGSNDDTVRIFDHESSAQVSCLIGHSNLVRAVQAGFGDPPGAEEAERLEALARDNEFWDAHRNGNIPYQHRPAAVRRSVTSRNAGSRDPTEVTALGASIPPGGGGSRWARIVSGSYDETVIIWRKDRNGGWLVGHRLRHADAVTMANTPYSTRARDQAMRYMELLQGQSRTMSILHHQARIHPSVAPVPSQSNNHNINPQPQLNAAAPPQQVNQQAPPPPPPAGNNPQPNHIPLQQVQAVNAIVAQAQGAVPGLVHPIAIAAGRHHNPTMTPARIYKLQFDARKIICASQDSRIVGWDFAAGDEEIMEASQFFVGV